VYPISRDKVQVLLEMNKIGGVHISDVEAVLEQHCEQCITTACINDTTEWDGEDGVLGFSEVFAGSIAPATDGYNEFGCDDLGLVVHYSLIPARDTQSRTPLSTYFVDTSTHDRCLQFPDIETIMAAYGRRGSFPDRTRTVAAGASHQTFVGLKTCTSHSVPSPSEGPGMRDHYHLYRQFFSTLHLPEAMHILHHLAHVTSGVVKKAFLKPLSLINNDRSSFLGLARIVILTESYYNQLHIDEDDLIPPELVDKLLERANHIICQEYTVEAEAAALNIYLTFIEEFIASVPTTCCYQFVPTREGWLQPSSRVDVFQVFLMMGLGISLCLQNFSSHTFYASGFSHCTTMPLFVCQDRVFFGEHPLVQVAAWGSGSSKKKTKNQLEQERMQNKRKEAAANTKQQSDDREAKQSAEVVASWKVLMLKFEADLEFNQYRINPQLGEKVEDQAMLGVEK